MSEEDDGGATTDRSQPSATEKSKTTKRLPTFRVGFPKQLDALRGYAVLSENGTKSVHYSHVAELIKVHEANVSSMNPFFLENGFIEKQGAGVVPHAALIEYNRAHGWNPETSGQKLAPIVSETWFGRALTRRLQFRAMSDDEAIEALASECMAGPDARSQLKLLLDYCETAGIVRRENGQLMAPKENQNSSTEKPKAEQQSSSESLRSPPTVSAAVANVRPTAYGSGDAGSMPSTASANGINFQVSIKVDLAEMKEWPAERIAAFFSGMAQVLAAQGKKEN